MRNLLVSLALAGLAATTLGCNRSVLPDPGEPGLYRFSDCGELRDYATDVMTETLLDSMYGYAMWRDDMGAPEAGADDGAGSDGPTDFTTTNVQEEGVDEIDIVKTDGTHLYVAQDRALHIVKSWPVADSELLSSVEVSGWIRGLFLNGDKVVVFAHRDWDSDMSYGLRVSVFDVSDRTSPVLEREIDVEGWMADGRMIDGDIYFVVNHWAGMPSEVWSLINDGRLDLPEVDWSRSDRPDWEDYLERLRTEARRKLRPEVERVARSMDLRDYLPSWRDRPAGAEGERELVHACSDIYRTSGISQHGVLSVVNLDLDSGDLSAAGLLANGWQIYASRDNLYVAQTSHWWWGWRGQDLETHIHKFELSASTGPEYRASGSVPGYAYDQFAFSEYDGHLRVVTSEMDWWWGWWGGSDDDAEPPANNVFVLKDDGAGELERVGEVRGIAPGERIFATRFMGERAYMVTFEMVDPLFTLDLSVPTSPRVVGELKIPGFSSYLHPMSEGYLLAVGMDGDDDGNLFGVAFSVFDVRDPANPTRAHLLTMDESDWSSSEALWNHHAFTYHRNVLTVPFYEWYWRSEGDWFSGVVSVHATPDELYEIGRVDHRDLVRDSECLYARWWGYGEDSCYEDYWFASVRRSVYIEDNLFSLSNYGLRVTDLNNPEVEHARVLFFPRER